MQQRPLQSAQLPLDAGVDDATFGFQSATTACKPSITADFQGARVGKLREYFIDTQANLGHLVRAHVQDQLLPWANLSNA